MIDKFFIRPVLRHAKWRFRIYLTFFFGFVVGFVFGQIGNLSFLTDSELFNTIRKYSDFL